MSNLFSHYNKSSQSELISTLKYKCLFEEGAKILNTATDGAFSLGKNSFINNSRVGLYVNIGCYTYIARSSLGRYCSIGSRVSIGPLNYKLTRPILNSISNTDMSYCHGNTIPHEYLANSSSKYLFPRCTIGSDSWIGDNSVLLSDVEIGIGAVIGAGSVVTKNVEPYAIYAGNPARFIRFRFPEKTCEQLLQTKWWELNIDELPKSNIYEEVDSFIRFFDLHHK